jgi:Leucine-rich repeat (LRR) protein
MFRYQIVKVSIGFHIHGNENVDFSLPPSPGAQHPLAVLERLPNLEEVMVSASRISREGVGFLAHCHRLSRLHLSVKEVTAEQLQPLATCRSLREFGMEAPSVSAAMVAELQPLSDLERLSIQHAQIDDAGMLELSRMNGLRSLDLFYSKFKHSTLGCLADLPNLVNLSVSSFDMNAATFQGIGRITRLRSLSLRSGIGDEIDRPILGGEIAELAGLTELRELYLESGKITGAALDTLLRFTKLQTLFAESELTDDEAIQLSNSLKLSTFVVYSPKFNNPGRICNEVVRPKLYYQHPGWSRPGYVVTSFEPR